MRFKRIIAVLLLAVILSLNLTSCSAIISEFIEDSNTATATKTTKVRYWTAFSRRINFVNGFITAPPFAEFVDYLKVFSNSMLVIS